MRLVEVMMDMRQLFAPPRDAETVGMVEVTRREDQAIPRNRLPAERRLHLVSVDQLREGLHADVFRACDTAIILERLLTRRFGTGADEWVTADFQPLRRREERHADRIADDGIGEGSGIDDQRIDAAALCGNGARQADGPGARYDGGFVRHISESIPLASPAAQQYCCVYGQTRPRQ